MLGTNSSLLIDAGIAGILFVIALTMRRGARRRYPGRSWAPGSDLVLGGLIALVIFCLSLMLAFAIPSLR